jgi:ABC-2 type transport system ATP-binding protein
VSVAADPPILSVQGIDKHFGERHALRGVSFDVRPGELVAVVGPNGAGKTTLLSIIAGVQRASAGRVLGPPTPLGGARAIGWAPQQAALYSKLSVRENLRLFAHLEKVADPEAAVSRMLEHTGLRERAGERVERLSGGNRQRVNVALGLIAEPRILALDEPSSALDPRQRARLWELLGALAGRAPTAATRRAERPGPYGPRSVDRVAPGASVLFSTHHLGEVRRYATRAIVLADGELLFDGAPRALIAASGRAEDDLEGAFVAFLAERGH